MQIIATKTVTGVKIASTASTPTGERRPALDAIGNRLRHLGFGREATERVVEHQTQLRDQRA